MAVTTRTTSRQEKVITKTGLAWLAPFLFFGALLAGCDSDPNYDVRQYEGGTMGTYYNVTVVSQADDTFAFSDDDMQEQLESELKRINQHMSTYIEDSELMRFNRSPVGQWQAISDPLMEVLRLSEQISSASDGAFDVTVGPLVNLWGFGPDFTEDDVPSDDQITNVKALVDYRKLELGEGRARRADDIFVDLSAIAKGYGVDWLAEYLREQGVENFLVDLGGDLRASGHSPRGDAWRLAIEEPTEARSGIRQVVELADDAMVTSGNYRNYYEVDGRRYSHTIDPVTGYPVDHGLISATVVAPTAAEADAWATALMVLGEEQSMQLAEAQGMAIYLIVEDNGELKDRYSPAFAGHIDD